MSKDDPFAWVGEARLKPDREASVLRHHPWIYRGALASSLPQKPGPIAVLSASGKLLGTALPSSPEGSLALRMVTFGEQRWDRALLQQRLGRAWRLREAVIKQAEAFRWLNAEGDGLPGLVADIYGRYLVFELYEEAWEAYLGFLLEASSTWAKPSAVLVRRSWRSGLDVAYGRAPEGAVRVREYRWILLTDLLFGQKTGLFLDQRENRHLLFRMSEGAKVLNLFAYSGGFAVAALLGGAREVVNVESSPRAATLLKQTYNANNLPYSERSLLQGDAFAVTRRLVQQEEEFDWVVVDPPSFVKAPGQQRRGLSGYRDINLQALKLVRPGGFLLTCSCSARIKVEELEAALLQAALEAGRQLVVLERRGAGPDHPVALSCPEARHLKVLWCALA